MEWPCEHIKKDINGYFWLTKHPDPVSYMVSDNWDKCPMKGCDGKRPEKPRTLAEKLKDINKKSIFCNEALAQAAFEHFCEVIRKENPFTAHNEQSLFNAMKESL